jgi:hypothetical protein
VTLRNSSESKKMVKKSFVSLMMGFGVTLAVLVIVTMPPGSWAVIVGVLLGLMAVIPVILVMLVFLNRTHPAQPLERQNPVQPIIIMQTPGYGMPYQQPEYLPDYQQYQNPLPYPDNRASRATPAQRNLPSRRKAQQPQAYYEYEPGYLYDYPVADPTAYEAYYGEEVMDYAPRNNRKRGRRNEPGVVEADYRTIGDAGR